MAGQLWSSRAIFASLFFIFLYLTLTLLNLVRKVPFVFNLESISLHGQRDHYEYDQVLNEQLDERIFTNLGPYGVRYQTLEESPLPPEGCRVEVVNSLERHGARLMTPGALQSSERTLKKIRLATQHIDKLNMPVKLRFLREVILPTETSSLLPHGALQAYYSGKSAAALYPSLASIPPFVRASGDEDVTNDRVILTAQYWMLGFSGGLFPKGDFTTHLDIRKAARNLPRPNVILSEKPGFNNTLDVSTCKNDNEMPTSHGEEGARINYSKSTLEGTIGKRLESLFELSGAKNLTLQGDDLLNLAQLCSFETLGKARITDGFLQLNQSPFCDIFSYKEWSMLGYAFDLGKWKGYGYGNPYHRAVATGFLRELLSRLTGKRPSFKEPTSLNITIDGDIELFPLPNSHKGPLIYFDGSHDNNMAPIVASLGLFNGPDLHSGHNAHLEPHSWIFSRIVPFQGKIVFEKMSCQKQINSTKGQYVRIRANGAIMRDWCKSEIVDASREGLCPLEDFAKMISFAEGESEWKHCFS